MAESIVTKLDRIRQRFESLQGVNVGGYLQVFAGDEKKRITTIFDGGSWASQSANVTFRIQWEGSEHDRSEYIRCATFAGKVIAHLADVFPDDNIRTIHPPELRWTRAVFNLSDCYTFESETPSKAARTAKLLIRGILPNYFEGRLSDLVQASIDAADELLVRVDRPKPKRMNDPDDGRSWQQRRDDYFLDLSEKEGKTPADIRDHWGELTDEERSEITRFDDDTSLNPGKSQGRDLVKKGIERAKQRRQKTEKK